VSVVNGAIAIVAHVVSDENRRAASIDIEVSKRVTVGSDSIASDRNPAVVDLVRSNCDIELK